MNVEFHYYCIHFLALRAGIPEHQARTIAYASQYVDSNIVAYTIATDSDDYETIVTQNYGWWDESFPQFVYLPFHFFPGGITSDRQRRDGKNNPLNCTANSPGVKELLIRALKTRNLYRVGIGLHTFADSWAHQNFSGTLEDWNMFSRDSPIPSIGHAHALKTPDEFTAQWVDPRLHEDKPISNRSRFFQAARKIYKYLCVFNRSSFDDADFVMEELSQHLGVSAGNKSLEERILDFIIATDIERYDRKDWLREAAVLDGDLFGEEIFSGYDKLLWLKDALLYRTSLLKRNRLQGKQGFYQSHLFQWYEAAKEHLRTAREIYLET